MKQFKNWLISESGECFSIKYNRKLKPQLIGKPGFKYYSLGYKVNGSARHIKVCRMVAILYVPNPENKPCVNHKDGNKLNDHFTNLEWVTTKENCEHSYKTGLRPSQKHTGVSSVKKINVEKLKLEYLSGSTQSQLSKKYNSHQSAISRLINS